MTVKTSFRKPVVDWLTVAAIAATAISFTVAFHEGVHALTCLVVGGHLEAYSALYASCDYSTALQEKIVSGSAPVFNLVAGTFLWIILRKMKEPAPERWLFLWLFTLMNWLYGAGYFILSGVANIGDWAAVIEGWKYGWLWRTLMTILGLLLYSQFVWLAFNELARVIGGEADEQVTRAKRICALCYASSSLVVLLAGFFCPYGLLSLPVWAGLIAVLGTLSPLLWMMRWFHTRHFVKPAREPLEIHREWQWILPSAIVVVLYASVLGRTLTF